MTSALMSSRRPAIALIAAALATISWADQPPAGQGAPPTPPLVRENATVKLADHVWAIPDFNIGLVPNVGIIVGSKATLVVDTGLGPRNGEAIVREVKKVSPNTEVYVVLTHYHPEHSLGTSAVKGAKVVMTRVQQQDITELGKQIQDTFASRSPIHAELLNGAPYPTPDILFDREHRLDLGGVHARLMWRGPAAMHTRGDTMIFIEEDRVLFTGDVVMSQRFLAAQNTSSLNTWIATLDELTSLKPVSVVPSHGKIGDAALIARDRAFLAAVQERVGAMKRAGKTVDEAVAAVAADIAPKYPEWGNPSGAAPIARAAYAEAPAQSGGTPDLAAIRSIVEAPIVAGKVAGASVVVARQGQTILSESFGKADLELDVPMPADASFEVGSVTKQFTAASVLLLAERGKLAIDDELTKYLPEYPTHGQKITIRHLLTHTSGIKGYTELPEFGDLMPLRKTPETLVKMFGDKPLDFPPGENLVYNNSGFFLLGLIIEKVSGQSYADFVKANLFDKVGMPGSYYCSERALHHHHAHGYDTFANALVLKGAISHVWPFAAGSLCSTAADLNAWTFALHGGKVLSADSYRSMTTPAALNDGAKTRYGFGIGLSDIRGRRAISHGGGINGFLSQVDFYPDSSLSVVVLLNTAGPVGPSDLARDIADVVLGKGTIPTATFSGDLSAFVGTFEGVGRGRPTAVTIAVEDAKLVMKGTGPSPRPLAFRSGETFTAGDALLIFERDGGRVARLRLDTGGGYVVLKKKTSGS